MPYKRVSQFSRHFPSLDFDNVEALYEKRSALPGVKIARQLCRQEYGMIEFDMMDLNGHRLVFAPPITAK